MAERFRPRQSGKIQGHRNSPPPCGMYHSLGQLAGEGMDKHTAHQQSIHLRAFGGAAGNIKASSRAATFMSSGVPALHVWVKSSTLERRTLAVPLSVGYWR